MSPSNLIPATARLIARAVFVVPSGPHTGSEYAIELYEGHASQGYKTGYDSVKTRWLRELLSDKLFGRVHSYSGERHLEAAITDFERMVSLLEGAKATLLDLKRPES